MSTFLPQRNHHVWSSNHVTTSYQPLQAKLLSCTAINSTTTTNNRTKHSHDQPQIIQPQLPAPLPTLLTTTSFPVDDGTSLRSTWAHRAWVTSGCATVVVAFAKSISAAATSQMWLEPFLASVTGYILADLGSGMYHWAIDNYGSASTPVFGAQIEAFQGHHRQPWTITKRQFANNLHSLGQSVTFAVLPIDLLCNDQVLLAFAAVCSGCIMFSQQFHAWAHSRRSQLPAAVIALQAAGVLVSPVEHAAHHRPPYNNNYCIVSGVWNEFLDKNKVYEMLEMMLFFKLGVRPRSWSEPKPDWTEESDDRHTT